MIDQYIYTRVDGGGARKDFGHGLAQSTSGITGELLADVSVISRYSNTTVDGQGNRIKVFEKRNLGTGDCVAFQQSVRFSEKSLAGDLPEGDPRLLYYSSTNRPQFLSHGYVCNMYNETEAVTDPDRWFYLDFVDYNVNLKQPVLEQLPSLPQASAVLEPLPDVLEKAGLSLDNFITAVRASFDTENRDTIELIEMDFTRPDAPKLSAQLLRWIFHFLPFAMRRMADFSSCYDSGCGGRDFAIALISSAMLEQERSGRIIFKGMPSSAKYGYIFAKGRCVHQKLSDRPDFDTSGSLYAVWLEQVIRLVYAQPYELGLQTLSKLDTIYRTHDEIISTLENGVQCQPAYYDALSWVYLSNASYCNQHIPVADEAVMEKTKETEVFVGTLLSLNDREAIKKFVPDILDSACRNAANGYRTEWLNLLCKVKDTVLWTPEVREVTDIYLAKLLDMEDESSLKQKMDEYFIALPAEGASALERLFFSNECINENRWVLAEVNHSGSDGLVYAGRWLRSVITEQAECTAYLRQSEKAFELLAKFLPEHLEQLFDNGLIPTVDLDICHFSELSAYVTYIEDIKQKFVAMPVLTKKIDVFYSETLKEQLIHGCRKKLAQLSETPAKIVSFLNEIRCSFEPVLKYQDGAQLLVSLDEWAINEWGARVNEQIRTLGKTEYSYLEDSPEVHRSMARELLFAYSNGVDFGLTRSAYVATGMFLMSKSYSFRTQAWYAEAAKIYDAVKISIPEMFAFDMAVAEAVQRYIKCGVLDCANFKRICYEAQIEIRNGPAKMINCLIELFDKGELPRLEAEMLIFYAINTEECDGVRNSALNQGLERILEKKGARALIGLLALYPGAEEQERVLEEPEQDAGLGKLLRLPQKLTKSLAAEEAAEYIPRKGKYDWMQTDDSFFFTLEMVIKAKKTILLAQMQADEMLCPDLIAAVYDIAPKESVCAEAAFRLNSLLHSYWEESKCTNSAAKKAMNELRRKGVFDRKGTKARVPKRNL